MWQDAVFLYKHQDQRMENKVRFYRSHIHWFSFYRYKKIRHYIYTRYLSVRRLKRALLSEKCFKKEIQAQYIESLAEYRACIELHNDGRI